MSTIESLGQLLRPKTLKEYGAFGVNKNNTMALEEIGYDLKTDDFTPRHYILYGPAGTGKTTLARAMPGTKGVKPLYINGSNENGVEVIRTKVMNFATTRSIDGGPRFVVIDEADRLSKPAQDCIKVPMEAYKNVFFIFVCNDYSKMIDPIVSRVAKSICFNTLPEKDFKKVCLSLYMAGHKHKLVHASSSKELVSDQIGKCYPDFRRFIHWVENGTVETTDHAMKVLETNVLRFIKGSVKENRTSSEKMGLDQMTEVLEEIFDFCVHQDILPTALHIEGFLKSIRTSPNPGITYTAACIKLKEAL